MIKNILINNISVIIPAYKPDEKLLATITALVKSGFSDILVVDDGSGEEYAVIFEQIKRISECTLLSHPVNRGKGAALKTAMAFFLENRPDRQCVVAADADGQHLAEDIKAVSLAALESGEVVLGVRDFSKAHVPARSKMGNRMTSAIFRLFFGMKIQDTQTGLRALPKKYIPVLLKAQGDRYEYETNMLLLMNRHRMAYRQVNITTVYIEENKSSHFRVIRDSIRVYALILKYILSSALASVIDALAFYCFKRFTFLDFLPIPLTFTAAFLARIISSLINFLMNAKLVFGENAGRKALIKYYILAAVQITVSATLVFLAEHLLRISAPLLSTLAKVVIDTILFFFSFRIQHKWVFANEKEDEN